MWNEKRKKQMVVVISALLLLSVIVAGRIFSQNNKLATSVNFIMDTVIEQKLYGKNSKTATEEINLRLQEYEKIFSMYLETSEISEINKNAGVCPTQASERVIELLKKAKEFSSLTNGAFDITVAPLTKLWGITSENPKIPAQNEIDIASALVSYEDIIIDGNTVMLAKKGQAIDLGAIAKGAACDIVREVAKEYKIKTGYVSIGGNLVVLGDDLNGSPYLFGIRDPMKGDSDYIGTVSLKGKTMATTGTYERFFEKNGKKYHHIIDPKTGYPAESDLLSVSIISEDGTLADFLSTTFFILGKETVLQCLEYSEFQIIAVDKQGKVYLSKSLEKVFEPNKKTSYSYLFK